MRLPSNGFQDRRVMTTSLTLQIYAQPTALGYCIRLIAACQGCNTKIHIIKSILHNAKTTRIQSELSHPKISLKFENLFLITFSNGYILTFHCSTINRTTEHICLLTHIHFTSCIRASTPMAKHTLPAPF